MKFDLKKLRTEKGMSIVELAFRSGVSVDMIYRIERDDRNPSPETISKLLKPLGYRLKMEIEEIGEAHSV